MKKTKLFVMVFVLLILGTGAATAEVYIEGYLGDNFTVTSPNPIDLSLNPAYKGGATADPEYPQTVSPYFIAGFKVGTWFVKEGFLGFNYPDWMKYFGFYLDFNYHEIKYYRNVGSRRITVYPSVPPHYFHYKFLGDGNIMTLSFMFAFRYGFLPTEKVPFGKIQPYVAVGPAILIATLKPTYMQQGTRSFDFFAPVEYPLSSKSSANIALSVETGVRLMITKFLSVDTSFKYRYVRPSMTYDITAEGFTHELRYAPQLNLFSVQAGVAYHF